MSSSVVDLSQHRGELRSPLAIGLPPLRSVRLPGQLRKRIRDLHCSRSIEDIYVCWCRAFIRFRSCESGCGPSGGDYARGQGR